MSPASIVGAKAITHTDKKVLLVPSTEKEWLEWVSATSTRNYLLNDTLIDWLNLYGEKNGFQRDSEFSEYDPRTDFIEFIFRKGHDFETAVVNHLGTIVTVKTISSSSKDIRAIERAEKTFEAMNAGVPVIYQGVLRNPENKTYGAPDLLIRSDELKRLFPGAITEEEASESARALNGAQWHYRVVDIKFTTLDLLAGGGLGNSGSSPPYKGQLYIYNQALGRIQGYFSPISYLLGRGWKQTIRGVTSRGDNCLERLVPVSQDSMFDKEKTLANAVGESLEWMRRLRQEGAKWSVLPEPTIPELRPNMTAESGGSWGNAKHRIARELEELTSLWYVGIKNRKGANKLGIYRWSDSGCTADTLGVKGQKTQPTLQAILDINKSSNGPLVAPERITAAEKEWRKEPSVEFYVDFETVNDLDDDFSNIPQKGGQAMIFMIGCGHMEGDSWKFNCFTAEALNEDCEAVIIDAWLKHMNEVVARLAPDEAPTLIHWSQAETSSLEGAYNAAAERRPENKHWRALRWFDFLKKVVKEEPMVVREAWSFGLKNVAQAMHSHGLIETHWEDGPTDGLGAMAGAWWCSKEAANKNIPLGDIDLMQSIQRYNEVDCKVMMEIIHYLRKNH